MSPFQKINLSYNIDQIEYSDELYSYGNGNIKFFKISQYLEDLLFSLIPNNYQNYFKGTCMRINGNYIRPHTDSDRIVAVNFYIKTPKAITTFWKLKEDYVSHPVQVKGQTNGHVYEYKDLKLHKTFISNPMDLYVLDVTQIHSVFNPTSQERIAYNLASNSISYKETLEILKDFV